MGKIDSYWKNAFPDISPVGWELRERLPERWVRFHSLPGGKRYPESPKERAIVVERASAVAAAVLGEKGPYYVLAYVYEPDPDLPFSVENTWRYHGIPLDQRFTCLEDSEADAARIVVFTGATYDLGASFEAAVLGIAEELSPRSIWVSPTTGAVYAPYDGGLDITLPQPADIQQLKAKFKKWLSKRSDGL
ncbi:MAG: hypothetical protein ACFBZ9_01200 [Sphingomonadales bacterium]